MEEEAHALLEDDYRTFTRSTVWADLGLYLNEQRDSSLSDAEEASDPMRAVSLLQKASAYKTIIAYIERMSTPME